MVSLLFDLRVARPLQNRPIPDGLIFSPACDEACSRHRMRTTTTTVVEEDYHSRAVLGLMGTSTLSFPWVPCKWSPGQESLYISPMGTLEVICLWSEHRTRDLLHHSRGCCPPTAGLITSRIEDQTIRNWGFWSGPATLKSKSSDTILLVTQHASRHRGQCHCYFGHHLL